MSIFDGICSGWGGHSSLEESALSPSRTTAVPVLGTTKKRRRRVMTKTSNSTACPRSSIAEAITTCGSNLSVDDTDVLLWEEHYHKDEMDTIFAVIRSDRLREEDERYRHKKEKLVTKEMRKEMLARWEDERQSIMQGEERGTALFRGEQW